MHNQRSIYLWVFAMHSRVWSYYSRDIHKKQQSCVFIKLYKITLCYAPTRVRFKYAMCTPTSVFRLGRPCASSLPSLIYYQRPTTVYTYSTHPRDISVSRVSRRDRNVSRPNIEFKQYLIYYSKRVQIVTIWRKIN